MSARTAQRNNVMAGAFLIISLTLAVVLSFWVTDVTEYFKAGKFAYTVEFDLRDGSAGLEKGSPVYLGGFKIGKVKKVVWTGSASAAEDQEVPIGLEVNIEVDDDVALYSNAEVYIEKPILGGLAAINIVHPGGPDFRKPIPDGPGSGTTETQAKPVQLEQDGRMRGELAPGLMAQAGLGPEQVRQFKDTLEKVNAAMADIATITGALAPDAQEGVDDVMAMIKSARGTVQDARSVFNETWSPKVTGILDTGQRVMDDAEEVSNKGIEIADKVSAGVDDAQGVIRSVQEEIDANSESVRSIIANVEQSSKHFSEQTMMDVDKIMATANTAVGEFKELGDQANTLLAEYKPEFNDTFRNVRLASLDARLFVSEIRSQPWRLFKAANTKESERQLLYSAARSYATAVSDLKSASQALDSVLRLIETGQAPDDLTPADIEALQARLRKSFDEYEHAENGLLDAIIEHAPSE